MALILESRFSVVIFMLTEVSKFYGSKVITINGVTRLSSLWLGEQLHFDKIYRHRAPGN